MLNHNTRYTFTSKKLTFKKVKIIDIPIKDYIIMEFVR